MKIDNEKLADYLAGKLDENDKKAFEKNVNHKDLESLAKDIKHIDTLLNKMNSNVETSSDFMLKLNSRIDEYEKSKQSWFANIIDYFSNNYNNQSMLPKYGLLSLVLIVSFTFYKINDNFSNSIVVNENDDIDLIANVPHEDDAIIDSLNIDQESQFIYNNNKISK